MTVAADTTGETAVHEGAVYYFCCSGCWRRFEADPVRYLTGASH